MMRVEPSLTAAFILVAGSAIPGPGQAQDLTISIWGGGYAEEFRNTVVAPFEKEHGVDIRLETGLSGERLAKIIATKGRGTDLVYFTDYQMAELAGRGLLQPIDGEQLNLKGVADFAHDPLGGGLCPAFTVAAVGLAYNSDLGDAPTSWGDLFVEGQPARIGFPDITISYGPLLLVTVAEMNGGGIDDIDPGFEAIAAAKDRLQIFTGREILDAINQGDVAMAPHLNIFVQQDKSVPLRFTFPKEGGLGVLNLACVVKGSANADLAAEFVNFHLSQQVQAAMLQNQGDGTVRTDVAMPESSKYSLISPEEVARLRFYDVQKLVENRDAWIARWQEEIIAQ